MSRDNLINKISIKEEKHFPNGTVTGHYKYVDKEGVPVHVRYYADDAGYGLVISCIPVVNPLQNKESFYSTWIPFIP